MSCGTATSWERRVLTIGIVLILIGAMLWALSQPKAGQVVFVVGAVVAIAALLLGLSGTEVSLRL